MCAYLNKPHYVMGHGSSAPTLPTAVTIVEVFLQLLSFILQTYQMWDLYNMSFCSGQDSYMHLVQMFREKYDKNTCLKEDVGTLICY